MKIKDIQKEIDDMFDKFSNTLEDNETKELDFS